MDVCNYKEIKTFVFLDLEGTGLSETNPQITEMALVAIHRDSLQSSSTMLSVVPMRGLPRIMDELVICFKPQKDLTREAARLTGRL